MAQSLGSASRPSDSKPMKTQRNDVGYHEPVHDDHNERVRIMAERYANRNCIWNDTPLEGEALKIASWGDDD